MKIYIIAGEASGDLHASNLMKAILKDAPDTEFRYWGGDRMSAIQGEPVKHISDLAFMGFVEVLMNLRTILGNLDYCKKDILAFKPDRLVLVDYPGFNLRIAEFAKSKGINVHYYISPQIWAWKQKRGFKIKRFVDEMYCILPFEKEFYKKFDMEVHYVGHPLLDAIEDYKSNSPDRASFLNEHQLEDKPILALLPGSRKQEIKIKLPIMLEAAKKYDQMQVIVAGAPNLPSSFYLEIAGTQPMTWISNKTYDILLHSQAAMVTSGTATLETALFNIPQVVCYKGSNASYQIAKRLIKVPYISLVNLIMDKPCVKELIQGELTAKNIQAEMDALVVESNEKRIQMLEDYKNLAQKLGGGGASAKTAALILKD
ncbi:lipid-A-disaccharide synthase [Paracrocinitomix mangrovi]|uniref:lipid-A-disaccharide synthase n=1 Tax=Paracrocinitomix mangrovi TaxID=2862509 RepID=UPI001C8DC1AB|nr:lipid-A-disaccharide synthase [Paracrocinitomix mangrovi]UKN01330.1 lipid-A-disaccharide synthase [Paracrocinitomix mangrovi]